MTTVILHGCFKKLFGEKIKIHLGNIEFKNIIYAIDCVKNGFRKQFSDFCKEGKGYVFLKKNKDLHIVPLIGGSGLEVLFVASILFSLAAGTAFVSGMGLAMMILMAISFILSGLYNYLTIKKEIKNALSQLKPKYVSKGGGFSSTNIKSKGSRLFETESNDIVQGIDVPIGYGRFKIGSKIIHLSSKDFLSSSTFDQVVFENAKNNIIII